MIPGDGSQGQPSVHYLEHHGDLVTRTTCAKPNNLILETIFKPYPNQPPKKHFSVKSFERQVESSKAWTGPMIVEHMGHGTMNKGRHDLDPDPSRQWKIKNRLQILGSFEFKKMNNTKAYHNYSQGKLSSEPKSNFTNPTLFLADGTDLRTNLFQVGGDDMIMDEVARNLDPRATRELVAEEQLVAEQLGRTLSRWIRHVQEVKHPTLVCLTAQHLG